MIATANSSMGLMNVPIDFRNVGWAVATTVSGAIKNSFVFFVRIISGVQACIIYGHGKIIK